MRKQSEISRRRILDAAGALARQAGGNHLSLDAVAARAGVSKGGLLYHFPSKSALLRAMIEDYVAGFEREIETDTQGGARLFASYVERSLNECRQAPPAAAATLAAIAEDPDFLAPIKTFKRAMLDRLSAASSDRPGRPDLLIAFLALEGMRSLQLFGLDILTPEEESIARSALLKASASDVLA